MRVRAGRDDVLVLLLQISARAGQRASCADRADETVDRAASLLPGLWTARFIMRLGIVEGVPLVGEQHPVRLRLAQLVGEPSPDMLVVVRIGEWERGHLDQFGPAEPQHVLLFLALRFRDYDQRAIATRRSHDRQTDAGIARGGL